MSIKGSNPYLIRLKRRFGLRKFCAMLGIKLKRFEKWCNRHNHMPYEHCTTCLKLSLEDCYLNGEYDVNYAREIVGDYLRDVEYSVLDAKKPNNTVILPTFVVHVQSEVPEVPIFYDLPRIPLGNIAVQKDETREELNDMVVNFDGQLPLLVTPMYRLLSPLALLHFARGKRLAMVEVIMVKLDELLRARKPVMEYQYYSKITRAYVVKRLLAMISEKHGVVEECHFWRITKAFGFADPDHYLLTLEVIQEGIPLLVDCFEQDRIRLLQAKEITSLPPQKQRDRLSSFNYAGFSKDKARVNPMYVNPIILQKQ